MRLLSASLLHEYRFCAPASSLTTPVTRRQFAREDLVFSIVRHSTDATRLTALVPTYPAAEQKLQNVYRALSELADSSQVREFRARARRLDAAIKHWTSVPPSTIQRDAMMEVAEDLLRSILAARGSSVMRSAERSEEAETLPPPAPVARAHLNRT